MTAATQHVVRVSQVIAADAGRLFDAWTQPAHLEHWWRMEGDGWAFAGATIDLRVGGRFRLGMTGPGGAPHFAIGEYTVVERPRRLAFTWEWEEAGSKVGDTLVTVEFKPVEPRRTEVIITHERFVSEERMRGHEQGWTQLLRLLGRYA